MKHTKTKKTLAIFICLTIMLFAACFAVGCEGRAYTLKFYPDELGIAAITAIPGIGSWTATYIAMRAWSWPDAFLQGDYLIKQRFPQMTPSKIVHYAERWRPWRAYATLHLWHNDSWTTETI